jgi:hypothetical protein
MIWKETGEEIENRKVDIQNERQNNQQSERQDDRMTDKKDDVSYPKNVGDKTIRIWLYTRKRYAETSNQTQI